MIEVAVSKEQHIRWVEAKQDASWQRYDHGRLDLLDRYDVTAALVRGKDILDIGCGQCLLGKLLRHRRPEIKRIIGVDVSTEMVSEAKQRLDKTIGLYLAYAEMLPFSDESFDTVVLGQTLEHVHDLTKTVAEALRVLKAQGRLIVSVPSDDAQPHGNHLRVFRSLYDMLLPFGLAVDWTGQGQMHNFYFAWGEKCG